MLQDELKFLRNYRHNIKLAHALLAGHVLVVVLELMLVSRLTRRFRGDSTLIFIANGTFGVSRIKITIYENDTDIMGI